MKKHILIFLALILAGISLSAQDTIVFWNFKTAPYDTLADGGNAFNNQDLISRDTSWHNNFAFTGGALVTPDKCISSTGWKTGNGTKYYQIALSSNAFGSLTLYSRQRSSGLGPKYFKVQYKITSGGTWIDVAGANVTCGDNFTSGVLTGINLPVICDNQPELYLRWIMTSDSAVTAGAVVGTAGTSRIDEIYIIAATPVGIDASAPLENCLIYPNPCIGSITISKNSVDEVKVDLMDVAGKIIYSNVHCGRSIYLSLPDLKSGLYFIRLISMENAAILTRKLIVR
jgi:hypothetical protein